MYAHGLPSTFDIAPASAATKIEDLDALSFVVSLDARLWCQNFQAYTHDMYHNPYYNKMPISMINGSS